MPRFLLAALLGFAVAAAGLLPGPAAAQSGESAPADGRVTGQIVKAADEAPLAGATVALRSPADSSLVTGATTDSTGAFVLDDVPYGTYTLRVSFVGYAPKRLTDVRVARTRPVRELGKIALSERTEQLQEVTVSAQRPPVEVQTDRTVYNTSQQLTTAGGTGRTVLESLPSIRIDVDGSISYRGNESVNIYINGEPTSLTGTALTSFLRSLSASAVDRVEVIPNPSAKYEPEGSAGIINIVLKRNRSAGWSGGVTATGGATVGGAANGTGALSGNLGYQAGPWRLYANYGFRAGAEDEGGSSLFRNFQEDPTTVRDESSTESESRRSNTLNTQAEYRPTDATTLSLTTVLSAESEDQSERTNFFVDPNAGSDGTLDRFARVTDASGSERSIDTRLSASHDFAADHSLEAELQVEGESESEDGSYLQRALAADRTLGGVESREREDMSETESEVDLEVDYVRPLGDFDLEAGYDGERSTENNDQVFEVLDGGSYRVAQRSTFDFTEQTHAAYGQLATELGDVKLQAGARAEYAFTDFILPEQTVRNSDRLTQPSFENTYFSVFPSAYLTYSRTEKRQVRLSYSKRVRRPGSWQLNPIDDNEDPTSRRIGNPDLGPEYIHSFELSMTRKWAPATVSVTPFFRRSVNEIERRERIDQVDGRTVQTSTYANFASSNSYGLEVVTSLRMDDWVRGNVNLNANRVVTDGSNLSSDLSNNAFAYSGRANLTFSLPQGVKLQLSHFYRAPTDIPGGSIGRRMSSDVALQKGLFDGKGSLSLRASDVFDSMNIDVQRRTSTFYSRSRYDWSQREVVLTFSYSFGGGADQGRGGGRRGDYR
jgi:outer membrane receptor protein involved in Fe transport